MVLVNIFSDDWVFLCVFLPHLYLFYLNEKQIKGKKEKKISNIGIEYPFNLGITIYHIYDLKPVSQYLSTETHENLTL